MSKPTEKQIKYLEAIILNLQEMMYSSEFDNEKKQLTYIEGMAEEVDEKLNPDSDEWDGASSDLAEVYKLLYRKILAIK